MKVKGMADSFHDIYSYKNAKTILRGNIIWEILILT